MKKYSCVLLFLLVLLKCTFLSAQDFMTNIPARKQTSLNGKWQVIIDPYDVGIKSWKALYKDKKPVEKSEFYEYSFDGGPVFDVPG
ncbi:MAG: Beta-glucuronidase, partial [Bacteroidota bacterium]